MIINSKYSLIKILGKGRSSVFLANDISNPEKLYALKIIPVGNLTDEEFNSLRNEFRLLNSLNHPNIVQAYEFGKVHECDNIELIGSYFYVSEYIEGKNLLEFFNHQVDENNLDKFLILLNQICTTLYYIHQLGIVHYDIRPENILIDEKINDELKIKLIDFGFSALKSIKARGTPLYISPELISGKDVDYRTDLYSLGATIYHTLSGKPPFYSDDEVVLLKKHLEEEPEQLPDQIPDFLREIVFKLLKKTPDERYKNTLEIIDYLPEKYQATIKVWPIPKIYLVRDNDFKKIQSWVEVDTLNSPNLLILSETGMGKSFLLKKFVEYLEDYDRAFFYLNPVENQLTSYNLLFALLDQVELFLSQKDILNKNELIDKISFLRGIYKSTENRLEFQQYQQNYLAEILIDLAKQVKYFLIIDDFQKFDQVTKNYFYFVYPSLVDLNIKFLITADTSFIKSGDVEKFQNLQEMILVPLSRDEIVMMLKKYFQLDFPYDEIADLLIHYTDNSVRGINEFLNNLLLSEILTFDSKGFKINYDRLKVSEFENLLYYIYEQKIHNLTHNQKLILEILSLINFTIKLKHLSEIINTEMDFLKSDISFLSSFGWIEFSGKDETIFLPKGGIKNFLFNKTKNDKNLNLYLAKYFEQNGFPSFVVAEFYERAGEKENAFNYYLKSANEAENYFSYSLMEKYLLKCLNLEKRDSYLTNLKFKLAQCYFSQSEFKKAQLIIEEIVEKNYLEQDQLFNLYLMLAIIHFKTGDIEKAYENFDKAFNYAINDHQRIEVELNQINLEVSQGNFTIAMKKCENLLKDFDQVLSNYSRAAIFNNLGITNSQGGFYQDAIPYFEKALQIYDQLKNKMKLSQVLLNLGNVYNLIGNREKAFENWNEALKINDSIGDLSKKALILNNIGISLFEGTKIDEAIKYYQEAMTIFDKINDFFGKNIALFNLAEAYFLTCDYEQALYHLNEGLLLSKKLMDIDGQCQSLFLLGMIYYHLNKLKNLQEVFTELLSVIESNKMQSSHLQYYLYLSGLLDYENKQVTDAEIKLNLAKELLKETEGKYFYCKSVLDLMRVYSYQGNSEQIENLFNELKENYYFNINNLLQAEAYLILGDISKKPGSRLNEQAIYYYSEALKYVEQSYIGEVTWQVLLGLGEEYLVKGAIGKGIELFKQANLIIEYIASKIKENDNKNSYLAHPKRKRSLEKIEKVINHF